MDVVKIIGDLLDRGDAAGYWVEEIGGYRVHHHFSREKHIISLEGDFPHFNPKVGLHRAIEKMSPAQYRSLRNGRFDRASFDRRVINRFRGSRAFGYLWRTSQ